MDAPPPPPASGDQPATKATPVRVYMAGSTDAFVTVTCEYETAVWQLKERVMGKRAKGKKEDQATWDDLAVAATPDGPAFDENTYVLDNEYTMEDGKILLHLISLTGVGLEPKPKLPAKPTAAAAAPSSADDSSKADNGESNNSSGKKEKKEKKKKEKKPKAPKKKKNQEPPTPSAPLEVTGVTLAGGATVVHTSKADAKNAPWGVVFSHKYTDVSTQVDNGLKGLAATLKFLNTLCSMPGDANKTTKDMPMVCADDLMTTFKNACEVAGHVTFNQTVLQATFASSVRAKVVKPLADFLKAELKHKQTLDKDTVKTSKALGKALAGLEKEEASCKKGLEELRQCCSERDAAVEPNKAKLVKKCDKLKSKLIKAYDKHKKTFETVRAAQIKFYEKSIPAKLTEMEAIEKFRLNLVAMRMRKFRDIFKVYQEEMSKLTSQLGSLELQANTQILDLTSQWQNSWGEPTKRDYVAYGLTCDSAAIGDENFPAPDAKPVDAPVPEKPQEEKPSEADAPTHTPAAAAAPAPAPAPSSSSFLGAGPPGPPGPPSDNTAAPPPAMQGVPPGPPPPDAFGGAAQGVPPGPPPPDAFSGGVVPGASLPPGPPPPEAFAGGAAPDDDSAPPVMAGVPPGPPPPEAFTAPAPAPTTSKELPSPPLGADDGDGDAWQDEQEDDGEEAGDAAQSAGLFTLTVEEAYEPDEEFVADGYIPLRLGETVTVLEDYEDSYFACTDSYPDGGYIAACYCSQPQR